MANSGVKTFLQNDFEARCARNSRYSLRSYAKFLEIDAPNLSKILSGKLQPGVRLSKRLLERAGATPKAKERLLALQVTYDGLRISPDSQFQVLTDDYFAVVSRWYYYAILEMLSLERFSDDPKWIAKELGISVNEVKIAFERLERLNLIKREGNRWVEATNGRLSSIGPEETTSARRNQQREILEKARDALETVPPALRDQSSMTMAIDVRDLPKVKELAKEFRRKVSRYLNEGAQKTEVYNLSVSFYPVTKVKEQP